MAIAAKPTFRTDAFIDGAFRHALSGDRFATENPATGAQLDTVAAGDAADIDLAVAAARRAFDDGRWSHRSPAERKAVLLRLADLIEANAEELAMLDSLEAGKPITDCRETDLPETVRRSGGTRKPRQAVRLHRADAAGRARHDHAASRSEWSGRPAVELPDRDDGLEGGARPGRWATRWSSAAEPPPSRPSGLPSSPSRRASRTVSSTSSRASADGPAGARPPPGRQSAGSSRARPRSAPLPPLLVGEPPGARRPSNAAGEPAGRHRRRAPTSTWSPRTSYTPRFCERARNCALSLRLIVHRSVRDELLERIVAKRPVCPSVTRGSGRPADRPDDRGPAPRQGPRLHRERTRTGGAHHRRSAGAARRVAATSSSHSLRWRRRLDEDRARGDLRRILTDGRVRRGQGLATTNDANYGSPTHAVYRNDLDPRSRPRATVDPDRAELNAFAEGDVTTPSSASRSSFGRAKASGAQPVHKKTVWISVKDC